MREPWRTLWVGAVYELMVVLIIVGAFFPATTNFLTPPIAFCFIAGWVWVYFANVLTALDPTWRKDKSSPYRYRIVRQGGGETIEYHLLDIINSPKFQEHLADLKRLEQSGAIGPLKPPYGIGGVEQ